MDTQTAHLIEQAERDLAAAEAMFEKGHFTWSLFIGHLVLERIIKALYVKEHEKLAPRIHDLVKLAKSTNLDMTDEQLEFLSEVSDFNMEARYPDEKNLFFQKCTREFADFYLRRIGEMYQWLKSRTEQ